MSTFAKGIHPHSHKSLTKSEPIRELPASKRLYFSVAQHTGAPAEPVVSRGDKVKIGTLLAKAVGAVSANIYSSVSGTVAGLEERVTSDGTARTHIIVDNDYKDLTEYLPPLLHPTADEIIERVRTAGIVGLGGAGFPTAVKLSPRSKVDTLIINAAECEPYITCDHRIMLEYTAQFFKGVALLQKALNGARCLIGIEDNKKDCIRALEHYIEVNGVEGVKVCPCKTKYPQGAEKQLIYALTRRKVPFMGGLPCDVGVIVNNVHTALSVHYAVTEGQPLFHRVMTVTGDGCARPANLWVRIGTPVSDILDFCGLKADEARLSQAQTEYDQAESFLRDNPKDKQFKSDFAAAEKELSAAKEDSVAKLINGGPMMGLTLYSTDVASNKTMTCLLLLTHRNIRTPEPSPCIMCSKCVQVCPMQLVPNFIEAYTRESDFENAEKYGAAECIGCGCCSYICPAKRPLLQKIALAKQTILAQRKKDVQKAKEEK